MADRPILFSAPMIRALLAGTKTQTRRVLKPYAYDPDLRMGMPGYKPMPLNLWQVGPRGPWFKLPYAPGDRLWVREQFSVTNDGCYPSYIRFRADPEGTPGIPCNPDKRYGSRTAWRPSIHMPRWASRLTLTVTDVRVQRLQEISEADAIAEGVSAVTHHFPPFPGCDGQLRDRTVYEWPGGWSVRAVKAYASLWTSLHGPDSWETNPWVVAVSFEVGKGNIDG